MNERIDKELSVVLRELAPDVSPSAVAVAALERAIEAISGQVAEQVTTSVLAVLEEGSSVPSLDTDTLLDTEGVAAVLRVSTRTVERLIADGELDPIWISGSRRFHPKAVKLFIRQSASKRRRPRKRRK